MHIQQPLEHRYTTTPKIHYNSPSLNCSSSSLITLQDSVKLMELLTYQAVEDAIKQRVQQKTRTYGQVTVNCEGKADPVYKINPSLVAMLYGDWIMPLTKEVQVQYLLRRLD